MSEGKTLWQILKDRREANVAIFNPLGAKVDSLVKLDVIDHRDTQYRVDVIREYKRQINGKSFDFVDYYLKGSDAPTKLRVFPPHQVFLLKQFDEIPYDAGFREVVDDPSGIFNVEDPDGMKEFRRLNNLQVCWETEVLELKDRDGDGKVAKGEVQSFNVTYWDFWRETEDEIGNKHTEFLFIEMDKITGLFTLWQGREIDSQKAVLF